MLDLTGPDPYPAVMCDVEHFNDAQARGVDGDPSPWLCSLVPGHGGDHETWVLYTFTDERQSQWCRVAAWASVGEQMALEVAS